jgi:plastocyanin
MQDDGDQVEVAMERDTFVPQEITIQAGTTVVWENQDGYRHSVVSGTSDAPTDMFNETVDPGKTFSYTFDEVGTYDYHCELTPDMSGTVIVE